MPSTRSLWKLAAAILALGFPGVAAAQCWPSRPVTVILPFPREAAPMRWHVTWRTTCRANSASRSSSRTASEPMAISAPRRREGGAEWLHAAARHARHRRAEQVRLQDDAVRFRSRFRLRSSWWRRRRCCHGASQASRRDAAELIAYAKSNPGKVNVSSTGVGSQAHITLELLKQLSGTDMTHVPYNNPTLQNADSSAAKSKRASTT